MYTHIMLLLELDFHLDRETYYPPCMRSTVQCALHIHTTTFFGICYIYSNQEIWKVHSGETVLIWMQNHNILLPARCTRMEEDPVNIL